MVQLHCTGCQERDEHIVTLKRRIAELEANEEKKGTRLELVSFKLNRVASPFSSFSSLPLTRLSCGNTQVSDLSPLKGIPLKQLWCDFKPERDAEILRSIKTLENINDKPAAVFWKEVDAAKKP